ncbi:MAG: ribosome biogenesis GTPase Der [Myxococcota bacterium]|nr:ribosome biogenesis GTPase Der [Myxococcota bacterium]
MRVPSVALVGRPNVGKSTLFNMLIGRRRSLVFDEPGVTRDRIIERVECDGKVLEVVDTGGLVGPGEDAFSKIVHELTEETIAESDLVVVVFDGASGVMPMDHEIMSLIRRSGRKAIWVVNKIDAPGHQDRIAEFYALGVDKPIATSAEHALGYEELIDTILENVEAPSVEDYRSTYSGTPVLTEETDDFGTRVEWEGSEIRVAVVGRPNAGKSTLVNQLLGRERVLASSIAGTTRDSVDVELEYDGQKFVLVDTAGIRRKSAIHRRIEKLSVSSAVRSIEDCDVVIVVLDSSEAPTEQDARILGLVQKRGKGVVIAVNKWDLVRSGNADEDYLDNLVRRFPFVRFAPMVRISAKTGRGMNRLLPAVQTTQNERYRRVGTSELNRFFNDVTAMTPPRSQGQRPKLLYVSQPMVAPPTFVFMCRRPEGLQGAYKRYLENNLRERYGFGGTPIWLKFRESSQKGQ